MKTRERIMGLIVLAILFFNLPIIAQQTIEERVVVKSIIGKVEVRSPKTNKWRSARIGMTVKMKWDIRTYVESTVELNFESGTIIKLGENSVVNFSSLLKDQNAASTNSNLKVSTGQIWANVKKLVHKKSNFSFETPTAVASIRGTRIGLIVHKNRTIVDVYHGRVAVRKPGTRKEIILSTKKRAIVESNKNKIITFNFNELVKQKENLPVVFDPFVQDSVIKIDTSLKTDTTILSDSTATDTNQINPVNDTTDSLNPEPYGDTLNQQGIPGQDSSSMDLDDTLSSIPDNLDSSLLNQNEKSSFDTLSMEDSDDEMEDTSSQEPGEVELSINSPDNNSIVDNNSIMVRGKTTPGARVTIAGNLISVNQDGFFLSSVNLVPGVNSIVIIAQLGNTSIRRQLTIEYQQIKDLVLALSHPYNGMTVQKPLVQVVGQTTPGAQVTVNDISITSTSNGLFNHLIYLPDEPGEYVIIVTSSYGDSEQRLARIINYQPPKQKLFLTINSPSAGQTITSSPLFVSGSSIPRAIVEINGIRANVDQVSGTFRLSIPVNERNIGEFPLDIIATDDSGEELEKNMTVTIDNHSPSINTSSPSLYLTGQLQGATRNGYFIIRAVDYTPQDQSQITVDLNGSLDEFRLESGGSEKITLEEGKNTYLIKAVDLAGNQSPVITGSVYYLPGPLAIDIIKPDQSLFTIDDLPPMPSATGDLTMEIEVEIEDGIGDVPETIIYCTINGIALKASQSYIYTGEITLTRGLNHFVIYVEDIAGNIKEKRFTITINE